MLLGAMTTDPDGSLRSWATQLGWTSRTGAPLKNKVGGLLKNLKSERCVTDKNGGWEITNKGQGRVTAVDEIR